jgi:TRAP-type C4-dicarboxylate transport system substrate-binding protein
VEELKKLLEALKDNIDPILQTQLLEVFDILDKKNQDSILEALREGLQQKQVVEKYQDKRKELVTTAVKKTQEIENRADEQYKEAMQKAETESTTSEADEADDMINQL